MLKKKENNFFFPLEMFSKADYSVNEGLEFLTKFSNPTQMELQFCSFWKESFRT